MLRITPSPGMDADLFVRQGAPVAAFEAGGAYPPGLLTTLEGIEPAGERERWDGSMAEGTLLHALVYSKHAGVYSIQYVISG